MKQLFPDMWASRWYFTEMSLMIASTSYFACGFLAISQVSSAYWRVARWVFAVYGLVSFLTFVSEALHSDYTPFFVAAQFGACIPFGTSLIFVTLRKRSIAGLHLSIASVPILILGTITGLMHGGVLPAHESFDYFILLGEVFLILMLAILVGEKLKQERDQAVRQQNALQLSIEADKLTHESALRFEAEARSRLAATVAHQLNNPLNYIQLAIQQIKDDNRVLEQSLLLLIDPSNDDDPEVKSFFENLKSIFGRVDAAVSQAQEGVALAAESVFEIRNLTGLDGVALSPWPLADLIEESMQRLQVHRKSDDLQRLSLEPVTRAPILTNRHLLKNIVSLFLEQVLLHSRAELQIIVSLVEEHRAFCLEVRGQITLSDTERRALEISLQSLGHIAKGELFIRVNSAKAELSFKTIRDVG